MNTWLLPAVIATFASSGILFCIYLYLYRKDSKKHLKLWAYAWFLYTLRYAALFFLLVFETSSVFLICNQLFTLASGFLLIMGTLYWINIKVPFWSAIVFAGCAVWVPFSILMQLPFLLITLPTFIFIGVAFAYSGFLLLTKSNIKGKGKTVVSSALILWGVHKFNYPFLKPVEWFAPWGYLIGAVLGFIAALGIIMIYFEQVRVLLQESELLYRSTFEKAAIGIAHGGLDGKIQRVNNTFCSITGYTEKELLAMRFQDITHQKDLTLDLQEMDKVLKGFQTSYNIEKRYIRKDGTPVWVSLTVSLVRNADHEPYYFIAVARDISWRKQAEQKLQQALDEKEILLKEIHHRVKNNLQIISSLLSLQGDQIQDPKMVQLLEEGKGRIWTLSLLHERLYHSIDFANVNLGEYINDLVSYCISRETIREYSIETNMMLIDVVVPLDCAVTCGLIINELVTNALKHAFSAKNTGSGDKNIISMDLQQPDEKTICFTVGDNGRGFNNISTWHESTTLGLKLVHILVDQLNGTITLENHKGSLFSVTFPKPALSL